MNPLRKRKVAHIKHQALRSTADLPLQVPPLPSPPPPAVATITAGGRRSSVELCFRLDLDDCVDFSRSNNFLIIRAVYVCPLCLPLRDEQLAVCFELQSLIRT